MNDCFFTVPSKPKKTQSVSHLSHLLLKLGLTGVEITQSQRPILQADDTPLLSAFKCLKTTRPLFCWVVCLLFKTREICKFTQGSDSFVHLST